MADKTAGPAGAESSAQRWIDNSDGSFSVQVIPAGGVASGATDSGNPVKVAGVNRTTLPTFTDAQRGELQVDTRGGLLVVMKSANGTSTAVVASAADTQNAQNALFVVNQGQLFNGTNWDRQRTPNVFKSLSAVVVTSETTIWTPAAGKKFRVMGLVISQGVATGAVTFRDNTGGSTIFILGANTIGAAIFIPLTNGILSAAANNVLTAQGASTETITGVVFGTEE